MLETCSIRIFMHHSNILPSLSTNVLVGSRFGSKASAKCPTCKCKYVSWQMDDTGGRRSHLQYSFFLHPPTHPATLLAPQPQPPLPSTGPQPPLPSTGPLLRMASLSRRRCVSARLKSTPYEYCRAARNSREAGGSSELHSSSMHTGIFISP